MAQEVVCVGFSQYCMLCILLLQSVITSHRILVSKFRLLNKFSCYITSTVHVHYNFNREWFFGKIFCQ